MKLMLTATLALSLVVATDVRAEEDDGARAAVSATTSVDTLLPGSQAILSVEIELGPGDHANSNRPKDPELVPTTFFPKKGEDVSWRTIRYPKPTQVIEWYSVDPLSVFESGAVIQALFEIAETAPAGEMELSGTLRVQVCDEEMCYPPERHTVSTTVTIESWDDE